MIMSVNIYDAANQLESDLRKTDEFKNLEKAFEDLKEDEEASSLFDKFRVVQQTIQQKQMMGEEITEEDRKSTRLNSSHVSISYAVFCLKKKNNISNKINNTIL